MNLGCIHNVPPLPLTPHTAPIQQHVYWYHTQKREITNRSVRLISDNGYLKINISTIYVLLFLFIYLIICIYFYFLFLFLLFLLFLFLILSFSFIQM